MGGLATVVDWGMFALLNLRLGVDYRLSVATSFAMGVTTNYLLNKFLTFKDSTRQVGAQIAAYLLVCAISLLSSIGLMYLLVDLLRLFPMWARVLTTGLMLVANFFLNKHITFNQRVYGRLAGKRAEGQPARVSADGA
jgi:putative flippase GtrA